MKSYNNISIMIHPTPYQDYDIVAVGDLKLLKTYKKIVGGDLIVKSIFGGIPILVIDTADRLSDVKLILRGIVGRAVCRVASPVKTGEHISTGSKKADTALPERRK